MLSGIAFMVIFIILCKYFKLRIPATMKDLLASVLNISAIAIGFLKKESIRNFSSMLTSTPPQRTTINKNIW